MVFESFGFENGQPAGVKQDIDFCHFGKSGESLKFGMRFSGYFSLETVKG